MVSINVLLMLISGGSSTPVVAGICWPLVAVVAVVAVVVGMAASIASIATTATTATNGNTAATGTTPLVLEVVVITVSIIM